MRGARHARAPGGRAPQPPGRGGTPGEGPLEGWVPRPRHPPGGGGGTPPRGGVPLGGRPLGGDPYIFKALALHDYFVLDCVEFRENGGRFLTPKFASRDPRRGVSIDRHREDTRRRSNDPIRERSKRGRDANLVHVGDPSLSGSERANGRWGISVRGFRQKTDKP